MPDEKDILATEARKGTFLKSLSSLPAYEGWSEEEITKNVSDILTTGDMKRFAKFATTLSKSHPSYEGWKPQEVAQNVFEVFNKPIDTHAKDQQKLNAALQSVAGKYPEIQPKESYKPQMFETLAKGTPLEGAGKIADVPFQQMYGGMKGGSEQIQKGMEAVEKKGVAGVPEAAVRTGLGVIEPMFGAVMATTGEGILIGATQRALEETSPATSGYINTLLSPATSVVGREGFAGAVAEGADVLFDIALFKKANDYVSILAGPEAKAQRVTEEGFRDVARGEPLPTGTTRFNEFGEVKLLPEQARQPEEAKLKPPSKQPTTTFEAGKETTPTKATPPGETERRPDINVSDAVNTQFSEILKTSGLPDLAMKVMGKEPLTEDEIGKLQKFKPEYLKLVDRAEERFKQDTKPSGTPQVIDVAPTELGRPATLVDASGKPIPSTDVRQSLAPLREREKELFSTEQRKKPTEEAVQEFTKRMKETGGIGIGLSTVDVSKFPKGTMATHEKIAYVLDPIMERVKVEVQRMVDSGTLKTEEVAAKMKQLASDALAASEDFRALPSHEKRQLMRGVTEGYVQNLRVQRFTEDAQPRVVDLASKTPLSDVENQRRGVRTQAETEQAATLQGVIIDRARKGEVKPGEAFNAEQLEALDAEVNRIGQLDPKDILKTEKPEEIANLLLTTYGAHAEAGRALQILSKTVDPKVADAFIKMSETTKDPVLKEAITKVAESLKKRTPPPPGFWDKVAEWSRNIKLAAFSAAVHTEVGNTVMQLFKYPEMVASAGYNKILSALTGKTQDRFVREIAADFVGTKSGIRQGLTSAWQILKEEPNEIARSPFLQLETGGRPGAIEGVTGKIVRTPQRLHAAIDAAFRLPSARGIIGRYAVRQAFKEDLSGAPLIQRITELMKNPTEDMVSQAATEARSLTFQQELGGVGKAVNRIRLGFPVIQTQIPFFNTPNNLFKAMVERTPFSVLTPSFSKAFAEAFLDPKKPRLERWTNRPFAPGIGEFTDKLARMTSGSAFMVFTGMVINRLLDGEITGRLPKTKEERDQWSRIGKTPYSVRMGSTWYSYRGFEPVSGWLGIMADFQQGFKDEGTFEAITRSLLNIARNFGENPFLVGVKDMIDALSEETITKKVERAIAGYALGMTIPSLVQQTKNITDPLVRKPETIPQFYESRVPGLSENVPPASNVFGEPIEIEKPGTKLLGVTVTKAKPSKLESEIERLGLKLGWPSDMYAGIKLSPSQQDKLTKVAGREFKKGLTSLVEADVWPQLTDGLKVQAIHQLQDNIRSIQRLTLFPKEYEEGQIQKAEQNLTGGAITPEERENILQSLQKAVETPGEQIPDEAKSAREKIQSGRRPNVNDRKLIRRYYPDEAAKLLGTQKTFE